MDTENLALSCYVTEYGYPLFEQLKLKKNKKNDCFWTTDKIYFNLTLIFLPFYLLISSVVDDSLFIVAPIVCVVVFVWSFFVTQHCMSF